MGAAEVISFEEVHARKQWDTLRQRLTGALTETVVAHVHRGEHQRQKVACPKCDRVLPARELVCRTVETLVGSVQLERPYFYCRTCRDGVYPLDEVLGSNRAKGSFTLVRN